MITIESGTSEICAASKPDLRDNWLMAKKRTAALVIDGAISSGIVSIPILFNLSTLPAFSASFGFIQRLGHALAKDDVVLVSLILLLTPIPIIYLRLCFRVFMNSQTPGEMLMGLVMEFKRKNSSRWMNEILYGIAQYWYVLCSFALGTIAFWIAMMSLLCFAGLFLLLLVLPLLQKFEFIFSYLFWSWSFVSPLLFYSLWIASVFHALVLCHFTSSRSTFSVNADHLLGGEVDFMRRSILPR